MDRRGYLGAREVIRVLGRWKEVLKRALTFLWELDYWHQVSIGTVVLSKMFSTYALESGLGGILGLLVTLALGLNCY